jgi:SprB repeat/Secretion system C-terminal sorting domain
MKTLLCVACLCLLSFGSTFSQAINEGFSNVAGLTAAGWNQQNLSTPIGSNPNWVQGDPVNMPFSANSLPANSFISANFNSVVGAATISNWLITPMLNLNNGDVITFYTRGTGSIYADNLQVRLSTNGSSTNVGASNISVGDFSNLLLEINPTLNAALYPAIWTQYTITISGLASPTTGRIAFRYYVPNGGPSGTNSDLIGIDDFVYTPVPSCNLTATAIANNAMGGAPNGTVTLNVTNGTAPYTYLWASGQVTQNLSGLAPGTYSVTVTDAAGCTASASSNVSNLTGPTVLSNSNVVSSYQVVNGGFTPQWVCQNDTLYSDGGIMKIYLESGATMITGGGIDTIYAKTGATIVMNGGIHVIYHEPGVNLLLSGGIPTLFPCPSLVFNYTQAPANGCAPVPVCNLSLNTTNTNIDCFGQASGSASVNVVGGTAPLTYAWSNGATSQTVNNLPSGSYTVTVTDANGCTDQMSVTITQPQSSLLTTATQVNVLCYGNPSGSIDLSVNGGTGAYMYSWSNGSTTQDISNLAGGSYTVTVTDVLGCTASTSITITEPTALSLTTTSTDEMMGMDGTATVTVTGGTPNYMYYWMPGGATMASISGLAAGTYSIMVLDANGCGDTLEVVVGSQVSLDEAGLTSIALYPNPSATNITVSNSASTVIDHVGVFTSEGRLVFEFALGGNESRILDISSWSPGRYVLKHASGVLPIVKL